MKFNPDSKYQTFTSEIFSLFLLNLLYIIFCLPVITIGSATSALLKVLSSYQEQKKGYLLMDFLKEIKKTWYKSSLVYIILTLLISFFSLSTIFWFSQKSLITTIFSGIMLSMTIYVALTLLFCLSMISSNEQKLSKIIKKALILPIIMPIASLQLLLIPTLVILLLIAFPITGIFFILIGAVLTFSCVSYQMRKILFRVGI